jgi:hypothetical protein
MGILGVLVVVYVVFFSGLFTSNRLSVMYKIMPPRSPDAKAHGVAFSLEEDVRITRIEVVPADAKQANPTPLWHLVGEPASQPRRAFLYGRPIKGMTPATANTKAQPLKPNQTYLLKVEAETGYARLEFESKPVQN